MLVVDHNIRWNMFNIRGKHVPGGVCLAIGNGELRKARQPKPRANVVPAFAKVISRK